MSTTTKTNTTKKTASMEKTEVKSTVLDEIKDVKQEQVTIAKRITKKDIPLNTLVDCKNLTRGKLIYISKKQSGYQITWGSHGDIEPIELSELISMRNSQRGFFENNWISMDEDIIRYLGVERYYQNVPNIDDFDTLFEKDIDDMEKIISNFSKGLKESVAIRASELISNGSLDSRKRIETLEKILSVELIEK